MTYAIIETGSKQYKVKEGGLLDVERLDAPSTEVTLDKVLLYVQNGTTAIGRPYLENARVIAEVVEQGKGDKVIAFKYKRKTNYHRTKGHRQLYTRLKIKEIHYGA